MNPSKKQIFKDYLKKFPEISPPLTLTEDSPRAFSSYNESFNSLMITEILLQSEESEPDEFTEFIPCIKIPNTKDFYAVIYWKASLMNYQFILVTYNKAGVLIDKAIIAGTSNLEGVLVKSVASIDEDWIITIVTGASEFQQTDYDPKLSKAFSLEIMEGGIIISSE